MRPATFLALTLVLHFVSPDALSAAPPDTHRAADQRTLSAAHGFLSRGLNELAIEEYQRFLNANPEHADAPLARYGLSVGLFRLGKLEQAATELSHLVAVDDFAYAPDVCVMLGQCRMAAEDFAGAADVLKRVQKKYQTHALADDAAALRIEALVRAGSDADAFVESGLFLTRWPDAPGADRVLYFGGLVAMRQGKTTDAASRFEQLLRQHSKSPLAAHAQLLFARALHEAGTLEDAAKQYRVVLAGDASPYAGEAATGLATILIDQKKLDEAAALLEPYQKKDSASSNVVAWELMARVHFERGDTAAAMALYDELAKLKNQKSREAAYWSAKCKLRLGDAARAAQGLQVLVGDTDQTSYRPEIDYDLAVALFQAGKPRKSAAVLENMLAAYASHALTAHAMHLAAIIAHEQKDFKKSQTYTSDFLARYADHPLAREIEFLAAENEFLQEDHRSAARAFQKYLDRYPNAENRDVATYRLGVSHYHQGAFEEARAILPALAERESGASFPSLFLIVGDLHFRAEDWPRALDAFERHLGQGDKPASTDIALLKAGLAAARLGKHETTIRHLDRLLVEFPKGEHVAAAHFERGQCRLQMGDLEKAAADFKSIVSMGNDGPYVEPAQRHLGAIAMRQGDYASAAASFRSWAESSRGESRAEAMYQEAAALFASGDAAAAREAFEKLLRRHPDGRHVDAVKATLAILYARESECRRAIDMTSDINFDTIDAGLKRAFVYEKAGCLRALGNNEESAATYRAIIERSGHDLIAAHAYVELAEIERHAQRPSEAIRLLESFRSLESDKALEIPPSLREQALYRLGILHYETKDFSRAADTLAEFVKAWPSSRLLASASYFEGEARFQAGDASRAVECFDRVTSASLNTDELGPSLLRAGECRAMLQQWARSESAFAAYLDQFPDGPLRYQAEFGVGWARENMNRHADAIKAYRRVIDQHQGPTAARAQFQIGQCLFAKKKLNEAVAELLKVEILYAYPEWSAAALYEAGRCFEQLNKIAEARDQFTAVVSRYKETKWSALAAARLEALTGSAIPGRS